MRETTTVRRWQDGRNHSTVRARHVVLALLSLVLIAGVTPQAASAAPAEGKAEITIRLRTEYNLASVEAGADFVLTGPSGNFTLDTDPASAPPSEIVFEVDPGSFDFVETALDPASPHWELIDISCSGGASQDISDTQGDLDGTSVTVGAGDEVTCVFVEEPLPPRVYSLSTLRNLDNFSFSVFGQTFVDSLGTVNSSAVLRALTQPTNYQNVLATPARYGELESITCRSGSATVPFEPVNDATGNLIGAQFLVDWGQYVICTFAQRTDELSYVTMRKNTIAPDGSDQLTTRAFVLTGGSTPASSGVTLGRWNAVDNRIAAARVVSGTIDVTEAADADWELESFSCNVPTTAIAATADHDGGATIELIAGRNAVCDVVNRASSVTQALTVRTNAQVEVVDASGNPAWVNAPSYPVYPRFVFGGDLSFTGTGNGSQAVYSLAPGDYDLVQSSLPVGYALTESPCSGDADTAITDAAGVQTGIAIAMVDTDVSCTLNLRAEDGLMLSTSLDPAGSFGASFNGPFGRFYSSTSYSNRGFALGMPAGTSTISVTESTDYELTSVTCTGGATATDPVNGSFDVTMSGPAACVMNYELTGPTDLTITKRTQTSGGRLFPDNTAFSIEGPAPIGTRLLDTDPDTTTPAQALIRDVPAGEYRITEPDLPAGWVLRDVTCTAGSVTLVSEAGRIIGADVVIPPGETMQCSFTNVNDAIRIEAIKVTVDSNGDAVSTSDTFDVVLSGGATDTLTVSPGSSDSTTQSAGTYRLVEEAAAGWELSTVSCVDAGGLTLNVVDVTIDGELRGVDLNGLAVGARVECTFTNETPAIVDDDADDDGVIDSEDNCVDTPNTNQANLDSDAFGDVCDPDDDNDGVNDVDDVDPSDPKQCVDADADLADDCSIGVDQFGPLSDNTPANDGPDCDSDGLADIGDPDDDNDGVLDADDAAPCDPDVSKLVPVWGFKVNDVDGDGDIFEVTEEEQLAGWELKLYDEDGILLATKVTGTLTPAVPNFGFGELRTGVSFGEFPEGTTLTVCETPQAGWEYTQPLDANGEPCVTATLTGGGQFFGFTNMEVVPACKTVEIDLLSGRQGIDVGDISIHELEDGTLEVTVTAGPDVRFVDAHLHVGESVGDVPTTKKGSPQPGQFDHAAVDDGDGVVNFSVPAPSADSYVVAVHLSIEMLVDGEWVAASGWGAGTQFSGKDWATYSSYSCG